MDVMTPGIVIEGQIVQFEGCEWLRTAGGCGGNRWKTFVNRVDWINVALFTASHNNVVSGERGPGPQLFRDNPRKTQRKRKRKRE